MRLHLTVVTILLCSLAGFGRAASGTSQANSTGTFVGTTSAPAALLEFLDAPAGTHAELVEWSLSLTSHSQYTLHASYGLTQPNFPGIQRDRHEVDRKGSWTARKGTKWSPSEDVVDLGGLAFVRVGPNVIHVLSADRALLTGNGAWSFSLNRADAAEPAVDPSLPSMLGPGGNYTISPLATGPTVYGVFEGRTPCQGVARLLAREVAPGCPKLKFRLTLYQNPDNRRPTTFKLEGTLYRADRVEGPFALSEKGVITLEGPNRTTLISLLKVSDDAVMFLDRSGNLLVGNASFSYTLERKK
ncbi:MAG TPA: hypothetical protein VN700_00250 [Vicinamibacterales bacterium]|nr:hypothetical protein [Vicinamibacterales bacterium]